MRESRLSVVWLLSVVTLACQATPPCREVPVLERFDVRYSGRMDGRAFQADAATAAPLPSDGAQVLVRSQLLVLPLATAQQLLADHGDGGERMGFGVDCARVPAADLRRALDGLLAVRGASEVGAPRVPCALGHSAQVVQLKQLAYVAAFQLKAEPQSLVADPVVGVATEGYCLALRPEAQGDAVALELSLRATELVRPLATATTPLVQGTVPVSIQVPVFFHQELSARPRLRPGEAVCVTCPQAPDRDEVVLLVLECQRQPEELPALAAR